jgi:ABC-type oligopeptide transport system substrate-binding subunit
VGEVKPDLTLIYWSPYYPNLSNFLTALLSSSRPVPNFTGFSNPQLDQAVQRLKVATGDEIRQVHTEVKDILDREMPWIPLYYETPLALVKPHVQRFRMNPVSVMLLTDVELLSTKAATEGAR